MEAPHNMPLLKFIVTTSWTGSGSELDSYRPWILDVYPHQEGVLEGIRKFTDVTGTQGASIAPDPNQTNIAIEADSSVRALIDSNPNFVILEGSVSLVDPTIKDSLRALSKVIQSGSTIAWDTSVGTDPNEIPTTLEFTNYRNELLAISDGFGIIWTVPQLDDAVGTIVDGRMWKEIHVALNNYLAVL